MTAQRRSLLLIGIASMLATMMYAVDSTIVNVALPHMQGSLQATQDQAAWIVTSYIVISAIATPLAGWLATRFGLRQVLSISIAGFTAVSVLCGIAADLTEMVVFRMVQGAFGAALIPLSQVLLLREFPREKHARVMALWGMGVMVGPVIGPTLGGWLTDTWSWRWAFFIIVPIGLIAWTALMTSVQKSEADDRRPFDTIGFVLLSLGVGLFQLMLDRGQTVAWFESTEVVAYAFFAAMAAYMFLIHSTTTRHPFIDLHLFQDRNFTVSLIVMFVIGITIVSPSVLLPGFLQHLKGYTPTQAGWLVAARGLSAIVAMMVGARMSSVIGPRPTMVIGILAAAGSLWMMGDFSVDTQPSEVVLTGVIQGFGSPLTFMPLTMVGFSTLPDRARTEAGALHTLLRNVGASVGVSMTVALLARSTQINQSYLSEHFTAFDYSRWAMVGGPPGANATTGALVGEIGRQAASIAYANDFYVLAICSLLTLPMLLALRSSRAAPPPQAALPDAGH